MLLLYVYTKCNLYRLIHNVGIRSKEITTKTDTFTMQFYYFGSLNCNLQNPFQKTACINLQLPYKSTSVKIVFHYIVGQAKETKGLLKRPIRSRVPSSGFDQWGPTDCHLRSHSFGGAPVLTTTNEDRFPAWVSVHQPL